MAVILHQTLWSLLLAGRQSSTARQKWQNKLLHRYHPDTLSDNVTCQTLQQVRGDVIRVGVQWSNTVMLGCSNSRTPTSVADYVTLLIDSHHGLSSRYLYPARHQLLSPRRAQSNETLVVECISLSNSASRTCDNIALKSENESSFLKSYHQQKAIQYN